MLNPMELKAKGFAMKPLARKDMAALIRKILDEVNKR